MKSLASSLKHFSEKNEILLEEIHIGDDKVSLILLDEDDAAAVKEFLKEQKADMCQGFYFSKAVRESQFLKLLNS